LGTTATCYGDGAEKSVTSQTDMAEASNRMERGVKIKNHHIQRSKEVTRCV